MDIKCLLQILSDRPTIPSRTSSPHYDFKCLSPYSKIDKLIGNKLRRSKDLCLFLPTLDFKPE